MLNFFYPLNEFTINRIFDIPILQGLYILGRLGPFIQGVFSVRQMEKVYPNLKQLGIDLHLEFVG